MIAWSAELAWLRRQPPSLRRAYLAAVLRWCDPPVAWLRAARACAQGRRAA